MTVVILSTSYNVSCVLYVVCLCSPSALLLPHYRGGHTHYAIPKAVLRYRTVSITHTQYSGKGGKQTPGYRLICNKGNVNTICSVYMQ